MTLTVSTVITFLSPPNLFPATIVAIHMRTSPIIAIVTFRPDNSGDPFRLQYPVQLTLMLFAGLVLFHLREVYLFLFRLLIL